MIEVIEYKEGMEIKPPMFIANMPDDVYHAWPDSISKSGLDLVHRSPAHYKYRGASKTSRAMEFGKALHCAVLEPEVFASRYLLLRHVSDRRASEYKQAVAAKGEGNVLVSGEADQIAGIQEVIASDFAVQKLVSKPHWTELSLFVNDPETGALVRVRYDMLTEDFEAVDLKTTQDCMPEAFAKSIAQYRYHVQAALYSDAFYWATGKPLADFVFLAIEKDLPHARKLYSLDQESMRIGRGEYRKDMKVYYPAWEYDHWHGAEAEQVQTISLPNWAFARFEEEVVEEIF